MGLYSHLYMVTCLMVMSYFCIVFTGATYSCHLTLPRSPQASVTYTTWQWSLIKQHLLSHTQSSKANRTRDVCFEFNCRIFGIVENVFFFSFSTLRGICAPWRIAPPSQCYHCPCANVNPYPLFSEARVRIDNVRSAHYQRQSLHFLVEFPGPSPISALPCHSHSLICIRTCHFVRHAFHFCSKTNFGQWLPRMYWKLGIVFAVTAIVMYCYTSLSHKEEFNPGTYEYTVWMYERTCRYYRVHVA